jgi:hypothetical protein
MSNRVEFWVVYGSDVQRAGKMSNDVLNCQSGSRMRFKPSDPVEAVSIRTPMRSPAVQAAGLGVVEAFRLTLDDKAFFSEMRFTGVGDAMRRCIEATKAITGWEGAGE